MKKIIGYLLIAGITACNEPNTSSHAHNADGSHPAEELPSLSHTVYADSVELFVEYKPLIVGKTSRFAAHLTKLGERFRPLTEGSVTVSLIAQGNGLKNKVDSASSPGIFRLALQPSTKGVGKLVFDIKTASFNNRIEVDSVVIYGTEDEAIANIKEEAGGGDITYLKEQAWKTEFANAPVEKKSMNDVIRATGQIVPAPGDEITISSKSNGVVHLQGQHVLAGATVKPRDKLLSVTGGQIAFENVEAALATARSELAISRTEYERASELIKDQLITQPDFNSAKLRHETAQINVNNLSRNYSEGGRTVVSPISGFIRNLLVSEGQYVTMGQPLVTIAKNKKQVLRVDVSLKDASRVQSVSEANFTLSNNKQTFNTKQLNGRLITSGKVTTSNSPYIPVQFEFDGNPSILAGTFADVYLLSSAIKDGLVIPTSALVEEQGVFYVYVQTAGESFQKREVKTGASDGISIQVLSGISEGERVVTKGGFQIKLSAASGALPAHGHEH